MNNQVAKSEDRAPNRNLLEAVVESGWTGTAPEPFENLKFEI